MQCGGKGLPGDECAPDTSPTITLTEVVPDGRVPEARSECEAPGADLGGPADPNQPRDEDPYAGDPIDILDNLADTLS